MKECIRITGDFYDEDDLNHRYHFFDGNEYFNTSLSGDLSKDDITEKIAETIKPYVNSKELEKWKKTGYSPDFLFLPLTDQTEYRFTGIYEESPLTLLQIIARFEEYRDFFGERVCRHLIERGANIRPIAKRLNREIERER